MANRLRLPQAGDYDPGMMWEVAESMIEAGFFRDLGYLPDLDAPDGKVWIGDFVQLDEPPANYLLPVVPLRVFMDQPVSVQLYAARLALIMFLLVSIWRYYAG